MFEAIRGLKEKPEKQRRAIAVVLSIGLTVVIFAFWVVNLNRKLSLSDEKSPASQVAAPLSSLKENFSKALSGIGEAWDNLKPIQTGDF